ncbi:MAG TPA: sigma 54-interacting transcriptional regulator [Planctomycetota bacterium]|nr:sigma 54-interacting transcriptional regulator [Planctomycetota bacterium]
MLAHLLEHVPADQAFFFAIDPERPERERLVLSAHAPPGLLAIDMAAARSVARAALDRHEVLVAQAVEKAEAIPYPTLEDAPAASSARVLWSGQTIFGVVAISLRSGKLDERALTLFRHMAECAAASLSRRRIEPPPELLAERKRAGTRRFQRREMADLVQHAKGKLVGAPAFVEELLEKVLLFGRTGHPVLVRGETGTGKEVIAELLHWVSGRRGNRVSCNVSALSSTLFQSELFGHVAGAFTDAREDRVGRVEEADGGTLFLDEIGHLPPENQVILLRCIQEKEFTPLGTNEVRKSDFRLVSATNLDFERAIEQGRFREDLYHRISVLELVLPPLRDRIGDVPHLVEHFLAQEGREGTKLDDEAWRKLISYPWPGNVRELQSVVRRAVVLAGERDTITAREILLAHGPRPKRVSSPELTRDALVKALEQTGGNRGKAADALHVDRKTVYRAMKKHGLL